MASRDAAIIVLRTEKRRAELLGLDAPAKVAQPGADRASIEQRHDAAISLESKLARLVATLNTAAIPHQFDAGGSASRPVQAEE